MRENILYDLQSIYSEIYPWPKTRIFLWCILTDSINIFQETLLGIIVASASVPQRKKNSTIQSDVFSFVQPVRWILSPIRNFNLLFLFLLIVVLVKAYCRIRLA